MKPRVAILDDEPRMVEVLAMVFEREGYDVARFGRSDAAIDAIRTHRFDVLITDLRMPGADGLEVLKRVRGIDRELPVILITAHATVATAISAMKDGAFDYVQKPFDNDELKAVVRRALQLTALSRENRYLREELRSRYALDGIVAESQPMQDVLDRIRRVARTRSTVLVTGESGTGKELVARAIHYQSDRVGRPFVAVNCKAFAEGVLESELFGHERGAFTGAIQSKPGLFERASGGTLFLDEIGEISDSFQAKLLRVLQDRTVQRVGGTTTRAVDVRVVAATNRDLLAEVAASKFREDLFFRLAVIPIHLPPLRDRRDDILPLARHFLARWNLDAAEPLQGFSDEVEAYFLRHPWPGNVRELENSVERGVAFATGPRLELSDLLVEPVAVDSSSTADSDLQAVLDRAAAAHIRMVLREAAGVRQDAARRLGVDRTTLYRLMRKYGIGDADVG